MDNETLKRINEASFQCIDSATADAIERICRDYGLNDFVTTGDGNEMQKPTSIGATTLRKLPKEKLNDLIRFTTDLEHGLVTELYIGMQQHNYESGELRAFGLSEIRKTLLDNYKILCSEGGLRPQYEERFLKALEARMREEIGKNIKFDAPLGSPIDPKRSQTIILPLPSGRS